MSKISENKGADKPWLSIEEAAKYLNMGKTVLYRLARGGEIPATKVGKKWVFEKQSLDTWVRSGGARGFSFVNTDFNIESNKSLRDPQREAYMAVSSFFADGKNKAIVQIPVGCGKTGLAALLPLGIASGRVLIIAPNLTIKDGLFEAMDITNRQKCFWRKTGVLTDGQMSVGPLACTLETGNISVAEKAHIVITNIHQLATNVDKWLAQFADGFFDMIIIDEAHHSAAESWQKVLDCFPGAKIVHMTATPFRSDRQEIEGELVYRYPFRSATLKGYIKRLKATYIVPAEIELEFNDERGRKYSMKEVMNLREEEWFSRGVALAQPCNQHIVDTSLKKLEDLRTTGTHHQLIAVACSINHAKDIRTLYRERSYSAEVIHSHMEKEEKESVLLGLRNGTLDCIIQVQMLGEGFDHPKLSVAAIFRPFRTLAPYIQFVGRIMRVVVQNNPPHPDNLGQIVTHIGMNLDQRLKEFKQFESDDEAFWDKVICGKEPEIPKVVSDGHARRTVGESGDMVVSGEIVDSLWEEDFSTAEDKHVAEEIRSTFESLGLDTNKVEKIVRDARSTGMVRRSPTDPFPILPQREWEEAKRRLDEQVRRTANILLNNTDLTTTGTEMSYKYTSLGVRGGNNLIVAIKMVNNKVNKMLGKGRQDCSTEEFKTAIDSLESILQKLVHQVKKVQSDYEKTQN